MIFLHFFLFCICAADGGRFSGLCACCFGFTPPPPSRPLRPAFLPTLSFFLGFPSWEVIGELIGQRGGNTAWCEWQGGALLGLV
ncbi:hypothetical protein QBC41DRAFT_311692 [Cercophora samala]|uniref:Secreted protein n=1 Tax=Cercophora samala TaxID=330535 RepID=A0AA39ZLV2_9PEZI|nr:hypothetical protein QBC41DRAFT_311692 [Cercophora samala]